MKRSVAVLSTLCAFLFGVIVGFVLSPIKKGIEVGNNNNNTSTNYFDEVEYED